MTNTFEYHIPFENPLAVLLGVTKLIECDHPHNFKVILDSERPTIVTTELGDKCIRDGMTVKRSLLLEEALGFINARREIENLERIVDGTAKHHIMVSSQELVNLSYDHEAEGHISGATLTMLRALYIQQEELNKA